MIKPYHNLLVALAALLLASEAQGQRSQISEVISDYVQAREGSWTLSRTLYDPDTGEAATTRAFSNPQYLESPSEWCVLNLEDEWRLYKKYCETSLGQTITAEFFDHADSETPYNTVQYRVVSAVGPDAHGWSHLTLHGQLAVAGEASEVQRRLHWNGQVLLSEFAYRPVGNAGQYQTWISNTLVRQD